MSATAIRRGWCPGVRRPMATGDGLLVRLRPPDGALSATQAQAIAQGARACGNGLFDISTRGNLQIRGVGEDTHDALLGALARAGLVAPEGDPANFTIVSPLAGLDPGERVDARVLARRIEAEAESVAGLPPKTAIVVDGGGALALDASEADVALLGVERIGGPVMALALASPAGPVWIGSASPQAALRVVARLLAAYAALLREEGLEAQRVRDLAPSLWLRLAATVVLAPSPGVPSRSPGPRVGIIDLRDGRTALLGVLPFGRGEADDLDRLAAWCEGFGTGELRLSPWRGFAIPGVARKNAEALAGLAEAAGLIVNPADPRLAIAACAGLPACASATTPTRRDAARLAEIAAPLIAAGGTLHVSGCAKGCAQGKPASLTLIGHNGAYGIVLDGTSKDLPRQRLGMEAIAARLSEARAPGDLAEVFA